MPTDRVGVIILAEDRAQDNLVRQYLRRLGAIYSILRSRLCPAGRGAGEQYVRNCYWEEVRAARARSARTVLIVVLDADRTAVRERHTQLERSLAEHDVAARTPAEPISHWIPKRNIETWILCLNHQTVDEETDYKGRCDYGATKQAAQELYRLTRPNAQPAIGATPSLLAALPEIRRIEESWQS